MNEKTWLNENGRPKPLEECTKEELIDRYRNLVQNHGDAIAAKNGAIDALTKRLQDHRKAKRLANNRADKAVKAMQDMLETFQKGEKS